jgi:hypothetical protein
MFPHPFGRVVYCYPKSDVSQYSAEKLQEFRKYCPNLQAHEGIPDVEALGLVGRRSHNLLVLDDLSTDVYSNPMVCH